MPRLNTQSYGSGDSKLSTNQQPEPESGTTQARRIKLVESEPRIEREHSDLLALEMEFSAAVGAGAPRAELFIRLTQLVDAFQSHFASEESLMRSNSFPGLKLHAKEHRKLIGQVSGLRDDIASGNIRGCDALAHIVRLWMEQHTVGPDTNFSHFLYLKRKYVQKPAGIEPAGIENAIVLSVSTNDGDSVFWERLFHESGESVFTNSEWTLITRATLPSAFSALREMPIPIVLCDNDLQPGAWRELLEHISEFPDPPLLIVTSRMADERLWAEALSLGAYDVLVKPLDAAEATRILSLAWEHWKDRYRVHRSRTEQRKATVGA